MTRTKRVMNILKGIWLIFLAMILFTIPVEGIYIVIIIVGFSLMIKGIGTIWFYIQMARSMVGGRMTLYRGIITLDLGLFIMTLAGQQGVYLILCTTAINAVAGIFSILRANEARKIGSRQWLISLGHGLLLIALMVIVIVSWIVQDEPILATYVYAFSLILSALKLITDSFKKTAIAYIP